MSFWFPWLKRRERKEEVETENKETETVPEVSQPIETLTEPPAKGAWLETTSQDGQRIYIPLARSPIVIGTGNGCDVRLSEVFEGVDKVKQKHARVELWRGRWVIAPLDTDAPIFVNGRRTGENVLRDGVEICLGENGVKFVFREGKSRE